MRNHAIDVSISLIFTAILFLACATNPVIDDPDTLGDYYVFCTLSPVYDKQELLFGKTVPEAMPQVFPNAEVIVNNDRQSVRFSYAGIDVYRDEGDELIVQNGGTYHLQIKVPNGKVITGTTTLPGPFEILNPQEGDTVQHFCSQKLDTLLMPRTSWSQSAGAKYYSMFLQPEDSTLFAQMTTTFRIKTILPDLYPYTSRISTLHGEIMTKANLTVLAYDSTKDFLLTPRYYLHSYRDATSEEVWNWYVNRHRFGFDEKDNHLDGAIGVFNGIAVARKEFYLKIEIDWPGGAE